MIYIYCPRPSQGARDLVKTLNSLGVTSRRWRGGMSYKSRKTIPAPDLIVCWGPTYIPSAVYKAEILNSGPRYSKFTELEKLKAAGVKVPEHTRTQPPRNAIMMGEWLCRDDNHAGASDLRRPNPVSGDFYVEKLDIKQEFRIHIFDGVSIRAGMKVSRPGTKAHPWIRSYDSGWDIVYNAEAHKQMRQVYRNAAKKAVDALDYDFGAVDIGVDASGRVVVFEVNAAPGLTTPNTALAYAKAIQRYHGSLASKIS